MNFNPHSHEGSDPSPLQEMEFTLISIHTPTKGATLLKFKTAETAVISIHTPTKGATHREPHKKPQKYNFNPHSHEGSD